MYPDRLDIETPLNKLRDCFGVENVTWAQFLIATPPGYVRLTCLLEKDPRVPNPNGRAVFLCFRFALKAFDFRHRETDSTTNVMGFDFPGSTPTAQCHR
jgi:hypothetical protein